MNKPTQDPHRNHPPILNHKHPAPFIIVGDTPSGALAIPITSARTAAQAARQITEHCPHIQATWQASPHAGPGRVAVFGRTRHPAGEHPPHQDTHAFLLTPGQALPPVWAALCGHQINHPDFDALDPGTGRPCPDCHHQWATAHHQHTGLLLRAPGTHLHPQLPRPPPASHPHESGST